MRPDQMDRDPQRRNVWVKFFERAVSSGSFEVEYAAGLGLTLSVTFNRIVRDGEIIGVSVFGRDITESRRAQDELRESEERFRAVSEHSLSGIAIADGETFRYVNPAFAQIAGRTPDELIGGKVLDLIFPDDRAAVEEGMRRRLS